MNEAQTEETAYHRWVINWFLIISVWRRYQVVCLLCWPAYSPAAGGVGSWSPLRLISW